MPLIKLPEASSWDTDINVPDSGDNAYGGINGNMFVGLKSLVNRVLWLKTALNSLSTKNTGTNTGDETAATIKSKLGISTFFASLLGSIDAPTLRGFIGAAPLVSPIFTGTPTVPDVTAGDNSTKVANTNFVSTAISNLVASSPATLDTLNELANALGDDPNFATTVTNSLASKQPLHGILTALTNNNLPIVNFANSDANNITKTGVSVLGVGNTNTPPLGQWLFTMYWSSSNAFQIVYSSDGSVWTRNLLSSWSAWKLVSSRFGASQTYNNLTGSRAFNTVYTNSTGNYIFVTVSVIRYELDVAGWGIILDNNPVFTVAYGSNSSGGNYATGTILVPPGTYKIVPLTPNTIVTQWVEFR